MNAQVNARPINFGLLAFGLLPALYFGVLTVVSGWKFTLIQFANYWYCLGNRALLESARSAQPDHADSAGPRRAARGGRALGRT